MPDAPKSGLYASARSLLRTAVRLLQVRVELLASDIEVSALRLFDAIVLALFAVLGLGVGLVLVCGLILLVVQEPHRPYVLGVMAAAFIGMGALALFVARARLAQAGAAFDATRGELARDVSALTPGEGR